MSIDNCQNIRLFGMKIDRLTMDEAVAQLLSWCDAPDATTCKTVVTPNVDHVVMYQSNEKLRQAYSNASLVLADGAPVIWASRLLRRPLPQRVAGSDIIPRLFATATPSHRLRVFLLGAAPGVAERAAERISTQWAVEVVGTYSPPLGFQDDPQENANIIGKVNRTTPDVLVVGLGAPKQELWLEAHRDQLQAKVALGVGATIDFLAGEKNRSPLWMQRTGLEWLHRVASEPKRLARRYAHDAWVFPQLLAREVAAALFPRHDGI